MRQTCLPEGSVASRTWRQRCLIPDSGHSLIELINALMAYRQRDLKLTWFIR